MLSLRDAVSVTILSICLLNVLWILKALPATAGTVVDLRSWAGHDYPPEMPISLPPVKLTVEESLHFTLGEHAEEVWHSMTPTLGLGYVHLGPEDRLYALSMVHDAHCLWIINRAFGVSTPRHLEHARHCIGYLRHDVLCDADLTLEPGDFVQRDFRTESTGATHVCRDWSAVYAEVDRLYHAWNATRAKTV